MYPVWDGGGFLLGVITSFLGEKYVYACTEAVEDVIVDHYKKQLKVLKQTHLLFFLSINCLINY